MEPEISFPFSPGPIMQHLFRVHTLTPRIFISMSTYLYLCFSSSLFRTKFCINPLNLGQLEIWRTFKSNAYHCLSVQTSDILSYRILWHFSVSLQSIFEQ